MARKVLLDALELLGAHANAITVVGAQALYLLTEEVDLGVAAYTADADLCLDTNQLDDEPLLHKVMHDGGFSLRQHQPGLWQRAERLGHTVAEVQVDLLVPEAFAGKGRRSVEMPPHHKSAAKRVPGLEPCVVDRDLLAIRSLDPADTRIVTVHVAGPAALLIAKAYKLFERVSEPNHQRVQAKDGGDVLRLMQSDAGDPADVAARICRLREDVRTAEVTAQGLAYLRTLFHSRRSAGTRAAIAALQGAMDEESITALAQAYLHDLAEHLGDGPPTTGREAKGHRGRSGHSCGHPDAR
ncbi:hypothetical protein [Saccharomonospora piscinae]|uniref:hypothetical protein n=1 Tax=Saccharomonospora piscinae TaxID=687388 RepID=UPI000687209B|nr:hypothetical protein [Saccharomonospora piscinae]